MFGRTDLLLFAFVTVASGSRFGASITRHGGGGGRLAFRADMFPFPASTLVNIRGGSTRILNEKEEEEEEEVDPEEEKRRLAVQKYRMDQQMLLQLRSTFLSEALARRGLPITTIQDVSTADGNKPPEKVDWDCAMSTTEEPKVSFCCCNTRFYIRGLLLLLLTPPLLYTYHSLVYFHLMRNPIQK